MSKRRSSRLGRGSEDDWNDAGSSSSGTDSSDWVRDKNVGTNRKIKTTRKKRKLEGQSQHTASQCNSIGIPMERDSMHSESRHIIRSPEPMRTALIQWFAEVRDSRGMPWRKLSNISQNPEERSQRAYEVWVSEIMLQQTQVSTVIPYYTRWMQNFPTLEDLAKANVEQVNALWKGLGYYSRASRLLEGAKKAVAEYGGSLPNNAKEMQKSIPGIGRYSAGAICSIAYGERVPVLDGNVHRLLSRILALHAPPKAKGTLDLLWEAANVMVQEDEENHNPGDINQGLIELGSTICTVRGPSCDKCPLQPWCTAYQITSGKVDESVSDMEDTCNLCKPIPPKLEVTIFPMKADRKKPREELDIVNLVEWRQGTESEERLFLLVKRPKTGLLAGLQDFPACMNVSKDSSTEAIKSISLEFLDTFFGSSFRQPTTKSAGKGPRRGAWESSVSRISIIGDVPHVFSHIRKTYRVVWILLTGGDNPPDPYANGIAGASHILAPKSMTQGKSGNKMPVHNGSDLRAESAWTPMNEVADATHVLNLSKGASPNEVQERYRSLSLVFHPDKQQDPEAKEVATRNFLKIQKAYEVLSDPFLREIYDQLGPEGLNFNWPEGLRSSTVEEFRQKLADVKGELRRARQNAVLSPQGNLHCVVNAIPLFHPSHLSSAERLSSVSFASYSLRHKIQSRINEQTNVGLGVQVRNGTNRLDFSGTVQHHFSPRLSSMAVLHLRYPFQTRLEASYMDGTNSLNVKAVGSLGAPLFFRPALSASLTRKLFRKRAEQASIDVHVGYRPHVKLRLISPRPFGLKTSTERNEDNERGAGTSASLSGLEMGVVFSSYGLDLEQGDPKLVGEFGVNLLELGTTLKSGLTLGFSGINWLFSAIWSIPSKSLDFSATTTLGRAGVVFVFEQLTLSARISRLEQRLTIPVVLSAEYNGRLALSTTVLPAFAGVLLYRFVVLPRRRAQRLAHLRSARRRLEESEERRERDSVEKFLRDVARRHSQTEKSKQGLVILQATYGSAEESESVQDLTLDVTIPLQALVRNSQLFIASGEETKLNIQGFFDPAPSVPKVLRIHYLFCEQKHYAEIPDCRTIVLPLLEHKVDASATYVQHDNIPNGPRNHT
ncbi:hypothetical protein NP233_g6104 [Leucocoprinus birnbaumii]|uniref:Adenine DNA glycosylase n=1 Tax=Leucocoprinus birnbaumii TaxID=56174 RepID=A0AAD5VTX4_9AGAR|nr:hypothetical protein NP233_g6104 [Leucocoprinus birnbaumii]